ncbi:MAG: Crp/Fnr family transcriptional regulator [Acidimicrobiia bacterium]
MAGVAPTSPPGSFTGSLTPGERDRLFETGRRRRFPRGSTLFNEGELSDRVVVLLAGRVKVSYFTEHGREVVLAVRSPGDLLGELSALDGEPRSATATALEPVEALVLTVARFRDFLCAHPQVAIGLLQMLSRRLRDADRQRVEFGAYDSVGRVARRLLELAEDFGVPDGGGVRITVSLTQEELAGWVGASRKAVGNALQSLRSRGLVETRRRSITVRDVEALRRRAV